jgi:methyl acetate hydrolase
VGVDLYGQRRRGADRALCRRALGWAGLANLFYWIDRQNGFGGFWAMQILPFGDPASFAGYMDFETAFYKNLRRQQAA